MSAATIVMQTDLIGGTMHTVRYSVLQGRPLIAPVPHGAHADEPKSRGILALTRQTGADLARLVGARGAYAEHLTKKKFADRPVAQPLTSRDGYASLLNMLEVMVADNTANALPPQQLALWNT
jgi:DNA processing protein